MQDKNKDSQLNSVYVINKKNQIVYQDDNTEKMATQQLCYKVLNDKQTPCSHCFFQQLEKDNATIINSLKYDQELHIWNSYTVLKLNWPNEGECILVAIHPINDKTRKVFLDLNQEQHYSELIELNLNSKEYRYLYKDENEVNLPHEGHIDYLIENFTKHYIYPDDVEKFCNFFDLDTLLYRTEDTGYIVEDFRVLRSDNRYHYFSLYIQFVQKKNGQPFYLCYAVNADDKYSMSQSYYNNNYTMQVDSLTYLYNQETFVQLVKDKLIQNTDETYAIVSIDIEHFKLFNEWYGSDKGDELLKYVAACIQRYIGTKDGYAARIGNDDFICFLPLRYCQVDVLETEIVDWIQNYSIEYKFLPAVGIYPIVDRTLPVTLMCDRAAMAANTIKGNFINRVSMYEDRMKLRLENEQKILFGVKNGLENNEFEIYFQPQCSARTHKIIGAEVLVRWNHPTKGLLMPGLFIPILEASGFIYKLDYYVWEKTCAYIHERLTQQKTIVPLSVNVSRLDIYQYNLVKVFEDLCEKYQVPKKYLEIEITESAYSENFIQLVETVSQLRTCGFKVLMDDFGSGYSALNMLKDIEVDVLKLDMKFLEMNENSLNKGLSVLESSILMAKWLKMGLIAEGVETDEQVKHLLNMNCEYMQGFHFYRPMQEDKFNELLAENSNVDTRDVMIEQLPVLQVEDLFHKDITSESMLNNILGGIAIYEVDEQDNMIIKTVNDGYYNITGCNPVDLKEKCTRIIYQVHEDDREYLLSIFNRAEKSGHLGASGTFRRYRLNGEMMWMHLKAFFLHKEKNHRIYYGAVSDYTDQMQRQQELDMILNTVPGHLVKYSLYPDHMDRQVLTYGLKKSLKYSLEEITKLLEDDHGINLVVPKYQQEVIDFYNSYEQWGNEVDIQFPVLSKDGEEVWIHQHIVYYCTEENIKIYCGYCIDINDQNRE